MSCLLDFDCLLKGEKMQFDPNVPPVFGAIMFIFMMLMVMVVVTIKILIFCKIGKILSQRCRLRRVFENEMSKWIIGIKSI